MEENWVWKRLKTAENGWNGRQPWEVIRWPLLANKRPWKKPLGIKKAPRKSINSGGQNIYFWNWLQANSAFYAVCWQKHPSDIKCEGNCETYDQHRIFGPTLGVFKGFLFLNFSIMKAVTKVILFLEIKVVSLNVSRNLLQLAILQNICVCGWPFFYVPSKVCTALLMCIAKPTLPSSCAEQSTKAL